uniref:NADH-ubiquinone oxidoreductase chain 5 n=1 Tax=Haematopinus asini TaxID=1461129 RepID=A0A059TCS7_9NEOP|nr:NADH dehydrogenase subunit 5 [Haematopinus asini]AHY04292.1 NADH dehydrogenase subunit 5 [Haematopinus asini]
MSLWHLLGLTFFYFYLMMCSYDKPLSWVCSWKLDLEEICDLEVVFCFDSLSSTFLFTVFLVSFLVFIYSQSYVTEGYNKFIVLLFLFVLSMCVLCLSSSLFWVLMGWDGLGLSSFCLILFYQNWSSFNSGLITFLINRLGDMFLIIGICFLLNNYSMTLSDSMLPVSLISLLVVLGAVTKSAQLPFSSWLPLAMAAPTPVSSLVHSSTLVTAGIYLLIRFECLLSFETLLYMKWISCLTILYAGVTALGEFDLKKIVALSTMMHLGIMVLFVSVGSSSAALVHLSFHAFFKSALFMLSGILIHLSGAQDVRMLKSLPVLKSLMLYTIFSMAGLPFFTGFYSKEIMLGLMMKDSLTLTFVFLLGVFLTVAYSTRLLYFVSKFPLLVVSFEKECSSTSMETMSLGGTSMSVVGGILLWTVFPVHLSWESSLFLTFWVKMLVPVLFMIGAYLGYVLSIKPMNWSPGYWSMWHLTTVIRLLAYKSAHSLNKMGRIMDIWGILDWAMMSLNAHNYSLKYFNDKVLGKGVLVTVKWLVLTLPLSLLIL